MPGIPKQAVSFGNGCSLDYPPLLNWSSVSRDLQMKKLAVMPLRFLRRLTWRHKGNSGKLRKELQDQLNSIGFEWKAPNALPLAKDSRTKIEALLDHKAAHGHLAVSRHDKKYPGLASWMTNQRARLKNGTIPDELKRRLDDIGFPWKPRSRDTSETKTPPRPWDEMFSELAEFFKLQGHCNVPND